MKKVLFFKDEVAVRNAVQLFNEFFVKNSYRVFDDGDVLLETYVPFTVSKDNGWSKPALTVEYRSAETETEVRGFIACVQPEFVLN